MSGVLSQWVVCGCNEWCVVAMLLATTTLLDSHTVVVQPTVWMIQCGNTVCSCMMVKLSQVIVRSWPGAQLLRLVVRGAGGAETAVTEQ